MNLSLVIFVISLSLSLVACESEEDKIASSETDFSIGAKVDNESLVYPQVDLNYMGLLNNSYDSVNERTWLEAYKDPIQPVEQGYWEIRVHGVDIEGLSTPYTLAEDEGAVFWSDPVVDAVTINEQRCKDVNANCSFSMSAEEGTIEVTSVEGGVIEGNFSGTLQLRGDRPTGWVDSSRTHRALEGRFRVAYRPWEIEG